MEHDGESDADTAMKTRERRKDGYPGFIGGLSVLEVRDMTTYYDSRTKDGLPTLPRTSGEMISFFMDGGSLTIRGSGTEPKIKYYIECFEAEGTKVVDSVVRDVIHMLT
jgi:phosphomannomutase